MGIGQEVGDGDVGGGGDYGELFVLSLSDVSTRVTDTFIFGCGEISDPAFLFEIYDPKTQNCFVHLSRRRERTDEGGEEGNRGIPGGEWRREWWVGSWGHCQHRD